MNKKILIILIVVVLILIAVLASIKFWPKEEENNDVVQNFIPESGEPVGKYIMEESTEKYNTRILESENKDFVTLYIETNIIESGDKVSVSYNNEKLLLNTANPDLENIEISRDENISTFDLELEALKNYGIIFIKKNLSFTVNKEDIKLY